MNKQAGSVHLMIISVLVVGLMVALGFIFWQNIIAKDEGRQGQQSGQLATGEEGEDEVVSEKKETYCGEYEKICFEYPKQWKLSQIRNEGEDVAYDNVTITSPDDMVILQFRSGIGPVDICCGPIPKGPVKVVDTVKLSRFGEIAQNEYLSERTQEPYVSSIVASKVETTFSNPSDPSTQVDTVTGYIPHVLLHNATQLAKKQTFSGYHGSVGLDNLLPAKYNTDSSFIFGTITFDKETNPTIYNNLEQAEDALNNETYQQAKNILLSARYKD
tara:strand:+ start:328 stop:1146 length:819 start_codon:yes stop_codon:yes gene_type:complete